MFRFRHIIGIYICGVVVGSVCTGTPALIFLYRLQEAYNHSIDIIISMQNEKYAESQKRKTKMKSEIPGIKTLTY